MIRPTATLALSSLAVVLSACAPMRMVGYQSGWVKTSDVSYSFVGPAELADATGGTYSVSVEGAGASAFATIPSFEQNGMRVTESSATVEARVVVGEVRQEKPGAMKIGKKWYPAFEVSVPYELTILRSPGSRLAERSELFSQVMSFNQFPGFPSREEAVRSLDAVRQFARQGIDEKALAATVRKAHASLDEMAAGLLVERNISLEVPVVRSAAGLDLEVGYELLASASSPDNVRRALAFYEGVGVEHRQEDGSPNPTASYGVTCGIAACKLLLEDLHGAWRACADAAVFEPNGGEAQQIRSVIFRREQITGVQVIPREDRAQAGRAAALEAALDGLLNDD